MVRITKCVNNFFYKPLRLMEKAGSKTAGGGTPKPLPIDVRMVPKYLELATYRGKDRFNYEEINEITKLVEARKSRGISPSDLIKSLLDIGKENGNILSAKEIKDFFEATSQGYDKKGQSNILRFIKSLKECQKPVQKSRMGVLSDNKNFCEGKPNCTSDYVSFNNRLLTNVISKSEKPETLARVFEITGSIHKELLDAEYATEFVNHLTELYTRTKSPALILDCNRVFCSWEVEQILAKMKELGYKMPEYKLPLTKPDYANLSLRKYSEITKQQKEVLDYLGLKGKVTLVGFYREYVDAMSSKVLRKGNFEGGKKR